MLVHCTLKFERLIALVLISIQQPSLNECAASPFEVVKSFVNSRWQGVLALAASDILFSDRLAIYRVRR